ncbi:uncharacterized protein PAC_16441 [Phialocephala subalpina]|uniref:Uncharacterized protein n=1 Tax=Phialocephala subalpina TaxID=576137 RepID=A0A1L7XNA8_9HELO|nr:uncharacterized protein PAC_16441 [Phialocephala subalpina]
MAYQSKLLSLLYSENAEFYDLVRKLTARDDEETMSLNPFAVYMDPNLDKKSESSENVEMNAFFKRPARILGLRIDFPYPYLDSHPPLMIAIADRPWYASFLEEEFHYSCAKFHYMRDQRGFVKDLDELLFYTHARAMHEKFWAKCSEFFLLALALDYMKHGPPEITSEVTEENMQEAKNIIGRLGLTTDGFTESFDDHMNGNGKFSDVIEELDAFSKEAQDNNPMLYVNRAIPFVLETFSKMQNDYTKPKGELRGPGHEPTNDQPSIKEQIWQMWQEGPDDMDQPNSSTWRTLSKNVQTFCRVVGHIIPVENPLQNSTKLLRHVQNQCWEQQEVITALSFRHLLENLPVPPQLPPNSDPKDWPTHTKLWKDCWREIWRNAKDDQIKGVRTPMTQLRHDFRGELDDVNRAGLRMYKTLSDTVHKYCAKNVALSQVNYRDKAIESQILKTLMPEHEFAKELDIDKERDRLRYRSRRSSV